MAEIKRRKIDLKIGEARIIRDVACNLFSPGNMFFAMDPQEWEYQSYGYKHLVDFLEERHKAPVIITNGANQALHAAMYALKQLKFNNLGFRIPYWNRIPEIAKVVGLPYTAFKGKIVSDDNLNIDSYLLTAPNNPDGYLPDIETLRVVTEILNTRNIAVIHDAVYYTPTYLPTDYPIENFGDVQIFSASKTFGLSSLRIGYMVVHNVDFYKHLLNYMELFTVGVSVPAQKMFLYLLRRLKDEPQKEKDFYSITREKLSDARALFKKVNHELIGISEEFDTSCGVFGWVKPRKQDIFDKAEIEVLDGSTFGMNGYYRLNLAAGNNLIEEAVERLNQYRFY